MEIIDYPGKGITEDRKLQLMNILLSEDDDRSKLSTGERRYVAWLEKGESDGESV